MNDIKKIVLFFIAVVIIILIFRWYHYKKMKVLPGTLVSSDRLISSIKLSEGFRATPYKDDDLSTTQVEESIGYGHQIKPGDEWMKAGITEEQAEDILRSDLIEYEQGVKDSINVPLSQGLFDALVDIFYEEGVGAMKKSTLVKKINANADPEDIADEFRKWVYDDGVVKPGIVSRREKNVSWFA